MKSNTKKSLEVSQPLIPIIYMCEEKERPEEEENFRDTVCAKLYSKVFRGKKGARTQPFFQLKKKEIKGINKHTPQIIPWEAFDQFSWLEHNRD